MKVKLRGGVPVRLEQIEAIEAELGVVLPSSFRAFVAQHDGARPENNEVVVGALGFCVQGFIPLIQMQEVMRRIGDLPSGFIPVAQDDCGNMVILSLSDGGVRFWDHEDPSEVSIVWNSFAEFLDAITPRDATSVTLEPGQVQRVWIDPEFLRRVKGESGSA